MRVTSKFIIMVSTFLMCQCRYMFNDSLVTVWSAPNYCYRCGNVASILQFSDVENRTPKLFEVCPAFPNLLTDPTVRNARLFLTRRG